MPENDGENDADDDADDDHNNEGNGDVNGDKDDDEGCIHSETDKCTYSAFPKISRQCASSS